MTFDLATALLLFLIATALLAAAEMGMPTDESSDGLDANDPAPS